MSLLEYCKLISLLVRLCNQYFYGHLLLSHPFTYELTSNVNSLRFHSLRSLVFALLSLFQGQSWIIITKRLLKLWICQCGQCVEQPSFWSGNHPVLSIQLLSDSPLRVKDQFIGCSRVPSHFCCFANLTVIDSWVVPPSQAETCFKLDATCQAIKFIEYLSSLILPSPCSHVKRQQTGTYRLSRCRNSRLEAGNTLYMYQLFSETTYSN